MDPASVLLLFLLLLPAAAVAIALMRKRAKSSQRPTSGDLPFSLVEARAKEFLDRQAADGSFIVFLTDRIGSDGGASFAQISIEGGRAGIDHVLTCEMNERAAVEFEKLLKAQGLEVARHCLNGVDYLRADTNDAPRLIRQVLQSVLGLSAHDKVCVIEEIEVR